MSPLSASALRPWFHSFRGVFFPPACLICDNAMSLSAAETVCPGCREGLRPARPTAPADLCPRDLDDIFALYSYGSGARRMIHRIKLTADPRAGRWLSAELVLRAPAAPGGFDLIIPIPSHRKAGPLMSASGPANLWAAALSERLRVPAAAALLRSRTVPKQTSLRRDRRLAASEGSLALRTDALKGCRSVLLADDVLTTGATARACARLLKRHGVARVAAAVIARG